MLHALTHLNYLAVFVVALAGFMFGWLWYSPLLFATAWMKEMKSLKLQAIVIGHEIVLFTLQGAAFGAWR